MKEILITSSVLIVALLVLRLVFAKKVSRRLIYGVWILVALRLLIPVQIGQMDFSVLTAAQPITEMVEEWSGLRVIGQNEREASIQVTKDYIERDQTVFTPEVQEYIQSAQNENIPAEEIATHIVKTQGEAVFVSQVRPQVQQQVSEQTDFISIGQVATVIWLAGVVVMAVWFAVVNLRYGLLLRKSSEKLECESKIPVYVSDRIASPCLVGFFRPVVYLTPASAANEQNRRHVLTHELTHYRHGDYVWALARCVCLCVYWFHPLVWVAAWVSRRDCELACDEGALNRLGETERIAYGKTLLEVVGNTAHVAGLLQTATAMAETKQQLKERVSFIAKRPKISMVAVICMVLICAIVAGCAAGGAVERPDALPNTSEPTVDTDATEEDPAHYFAMYDYNTVITGWIELDKLGNAVFYSSRTIQIDEWELQNYGFKRGPAYLTTIQRYSGSCVLHEDTYTLQVTKAEYTYNLNFSDAEALAQAYIDASLPQDRKENEKLYRGEFVEIPYLPVLQVIFRMADGKPTYLEMEYDDGRRQICQFYPNGNTKTIEESYKTIVEDISTSYRVEFYEHGPVRSYRRWKDGDSENFYLEEYNEYGDMVSKGNYWIDYRLNGYEYDYEYYEDSARKQFWQYSVGEGVTNRSLQLHYEYYPDGIMKSNRTYYTNGNLQRYAEFDQWGYQVLWEEYNTDGVLLSRRHYERRVSDDGIVLEMKQYLNGVLVAHFMYFDNGEVKVRREYYTNGQLMLYVEYDEQGNEIIYNYYYEDGTQG